MFTGIIETTATVEALDVHGLRPSLAVGHSVGEIAAAPDEVLGACGQDEAGGRFARRGDRVPALVLYHPSPAVVRRALSLLEGHVRGDIERVIGHLTSHPDPEIRASALAASSRTGCHHDRLLQSLDDREPYVRAAASVGLIADPRHASAAHAAAEALRSGTPEERIALVRAIPIRWRILSIAALNSAVVVVLAGLIWSGSGET